MCRCRWMDSRPDRTSGRCDEPATPRLPGRDRRVVVGFHAPLHQTSRSRGCCRGAGTPGDLVCGVRCRGVVRGAGLAPAVASRRPPFRGGGRRAGRRHPLAVNWGDLHLRRQHRPRGGDCAGLLHRPACRRLAGRRRPQGAAARGPVDRGGNRRYGGRRTHGRLRANSLHRVGAGAELCRVRADQESDRHPRRPAAAARLAAGRRRPARGPAADLRFTADEAVLPERRDGPDPDAGRRRCARSTHRGLDRRAAARCVVDAGPRRPGLVHRRVRGDDRFILDYLADEVLERQPPASATSCSTRRS